MHIYTYIYIYICIYMYIYTYIYTYTELTHKVSRLFLTKQKIQHQLVHAVVDKTLQGPVYIYMCIRKYICTKYVCMEI